MEKLSEFERVLAVFTRPKKAMEDIRDNPTILVPILCLIIVPVLSFVLGMGPARDLLIRQFQELGMTGDLSGMVQFSLYGALAMAPIMSVAGWFVYSLVIFFLCQMFGGDGELSFKKARSLVGYAYLVTIPFTLITTVILLVSPVAIENSITLSLYDIVKQFAPTENLYVISLFQTLSLAKIWETVVLVIGIKTMKEISAGKATAIVLIAIALQYAVQIGSAAMSSSALGMA